MLFRCDAHKRREFFTLRPRAKDDELIGRIVADVLCGDNGALADRKQTRPLGDLYIVFNRAALGNNLLAVFLGAFNDSHHAFKLRSEGADDKASRNRPNNLIKRLLDPLFWN